MQTIPFRIDRLITMARNGQLVVPEFQRDFVWKRPQVAKLIDSVARGYPVGSILLLRRTEFNFQSRRLIPDGAGVFPITPPDANVGDETFYILDGQQRVTSLIRVFANVAQNGTYYVDLKKLCETFAVGDDSAESDDSATWLYFKPNKGGGSRGPASVSQYQLLATQTILHSKNTSVLVDTYFDDDFSGDTDRKRQSKATVNEVFETIRNFEVPAVVMDQNTGVEAICRVFETINSTGTKLTTFDLATARFYPDPSLRDAWNAAAEVYPQLKAMEIDGERVLQIIAVWTAHLAGRRGEPSRAGLLRLERQAIKTHWDNAFEALAEACDWVQRRGVYNHGQLPGEAILVPLAAILSKPFLKAAGLTQPDGFGDLLEQWYWLAALSRAFDVSTNQQIAIQFDRLVLAIRTGKLEVGEPLIITAELLTKTRADRDSRGKAIQSLVLACHPRDIRTGGDMPPESEIESHHIFPKAVLSGHADVESVANRLWVLTTTNRKLSAVPPHEYIGKLLTAARTNGTEQQLMARLEAQCVPCEPFAADGSVAARYELFLDARAKLILGLIEQRIGKKNLVTDPTAAALGGASDEQE